MTKATHLTVGPTQLYPRAAQAYKEGIDSCIASISHRSEAYMNIHAEASDYLRRLFSLPEAVHVFFLGSATEAMERLVEGAVVTQSFHLVNGAFSEKWYSIAKELGKNAVSCHVGYGAGFTGGGLQPPAEAEMICVTQNETSTGVFTPDAVIRELREKAPEAIIAVDAVSSAPAHPLDFSLIDAAFFSVQKGFGLPAGLGVLLCHERVLERMRSRDDACCMGSYHSLLSLCEKGKKNQTPATPNVLGIYALGKVAGELAKRGMDAIQQERQSKAGMIYEGLRECGLEPFPSKDHSETTIVARVDDAGRILQKLAGEGIYMSNGYGPYKGQHIRIGNYPAHSYEDVRRAMSALRNLVA